MQSTQRAVRQPARAAKPHVDFKVVRNDEAHWTIQPLSETAKAIAAKEFGLDSRSPQDIGIVVGYIRSNAMLHSLRSRGYSILYMGPAGPITL